MPDTHLTVAAVIEDHGRFLCVEEIDDGRHVINQPAGHVDPGESLVQAAVRETLEETAWHFEPAAIVGIYLWQHPCKDERFLRTVFTGTVRRHDADRALDTEILRALWLSRAELLERSASLRSPMVLRAIEDYLAGQRYPLDLVQQIGIAELTERAAVI